METFMDGATFIEATLLSFLLALWITWLGLRGLFRLMPGTRPDAVPIRLAVRRAARAPGRIVA
jgi:hypothetical protein